MRKFRRIGGFRLPFTYLVVSPVWQRGGGTERKVYAGLRKLDRSEPIEESIAKGGAEQLGVIPPRLIYVCMHGASSFARV